MGEPRPWLRAVSGMKSMALLLILVWHCGVLKAPDLGARCCEIFFVSSGFLEAYRHGFSWEFTLEECFLSVRRKLRVIYPMYLASLLSAVALSFLTGKITLELRFVGTMLPYLLLMQSWFPKIALLPEYNGASWFLSALLLCYAATPFVAYVVKRVMGATALGSKVLKMSLLMATIFLVRTVAELLAVTFPDIYSYSVHSNPLVRLLEFSLAYCVGIVFTDFLSTRDISPWKKATLELSIVAVYVTAVWYGNALLPRSAFVFLACPLVVVFARGEGPISRFLSLAPLQSFYAIEMSFYLFHQTACRIAAIDVFKTLYSGIRGGRIIHVTIALALTLLFVMAWRLLSTAFNSRFHRLNVG